MSLHGHTLWKGRQGLVGGCSFQQEQVLNVALEAINLVVAFSFAPSSSLQNLGRLGQRLHSLLRCAWARGQDVCA